MEYFSLLDRECGIDKPNFIGHLDKTICFIDFQIQHGSIKDGGRIVEYSAIKCYNDKIETFHVLARPCYSPINNKMKETRKYWSDLIGLNDENIKDCRSTFEVFKDFYSFISDSNIVIFNNYKRHFPLIKFYLIELELPLPRVWFWDTKNLVRRDYPTFKEQLINEHRGFIRAYKSLLLYDAANGAKLTEKRIDDIMYSFWNHPTKVHEEKIKLFKRDLAKYYKWLRTGRRHMAQGLRDYLDKFGSPLEQYNKERANNVQKSECAK